MTTSDKMIHHFFRFQHELKLYHWRTQRYSRHRASDSLGKAMSELIDRFVEAYMGIFKRVTLDGTQSTLKIRTFDDHTAPSLLSHFITFLESLYKNPVIKKETSLTTLIDEMLSQLQQTLYLFTLE